MADDIRTLSDELARNPGSLAFVPLGEALRRQGQLAHALKIVLRGLDRHPHHADAHDLLARVYADQGEAQKAFDEWDMVRRLAPGHPGAAKGMGLICFNEGRLADAERYLREALAGAPDDDSIASALEFVRAAGGVDRGSGATPATTGIVASSTPFITSTPSTPSAAFAPPTPTPAAPAATVTLPAMTGTASPPAAPVIDPADPRYLFATVLADEDQTALLLDRDGLVLAGAYHTWDGRDVAQEIGAELSGVSDEATRATRHLGIGSWRSIVFETEVASVAMVPTASDGLLVLAVGSATPLGLTRRLLERCAAHARAWLGGEA